jgi:hypothetical protein
VRHAITRDLARGGEEVEVGIAGEEIQTGNTEEHYVDMQSVIKGTVSQRFVKGSKILTTETNFCSLRDEVSVSYGKPHLWNGPVLVRQQGTEATLNFPLYICAVAVRKTKFNIYV